MMESNNTNILNKSDISNLAWRSTLLQASFNFERMQACGFLDAQLPALEKIYKDDQVGLKEAMQDNLNFINTHPVTVSFLLGLLISLEEKGESRSTIQGLKIALFPPLAGIGDALLWFTLLPIVAGICSSFAMNGSYLGPILFFIVYLGIFLLRFPLTHIGYRLGINSVEKIKEKSELFSKSATIIGITVIGGLIASYVQIELVSTISLSETNVVNLQTDFLDKLFPNILPFAYTMLMFYLLKHKKINPITLIVATFLIAIIGSALGIL